MRPGSSAGARSVPWTTMIRHACPMRSRPRMILEQHSPLPLRAALCQRPGVRIPYFQIDAFTNRVFGGNPAGVCLLDSWLDDGVLQQIASENNLSETAFVVTKDEQFEIRWFTPELEIGL